MLDDETKNLVLKKYFLVILYNKKMLNYFLFFICLIPARKRNDRAIIRPIEIISKGVIIKNDPPELIPKIENKTVYPITKTVRIIAREIIKIPNILDFCINIIFYKSKFW